MATLVDTSVLVALGNRDDSLHQRALALAPTLEEPFLTEEVFAELMNVLSRRQDKNYAKKYGASILLQMSLARVSKAEFHQGWELFVQPNKLSFTDCTSIALARSFGASVATFDEEFAKHANVPIIR